MEWLTAVLSLLPLPWLMLCLSWIGMGWVIKHMWDRANELQDKNLSSVKESAQKLADLNVKMVASLDAIINTYEKREIARGRSKRR